MDLQINFNYFLNYLSLIIILNNKNANVSLDYYIKVNTLLNYSID